MNEVKLPHSEGHEKSVVSTLLQQGMHIEGAETLTPEHFHNPATRASFRELQTIENGPIDLVEFAQRAQSKGFLESMGGPGVISELYGYAPTSAHFSHHLAKLHVLKAKRAACSAAMRLLEASQDHSDDETFLERSLEPMTEIHDIASATKKARTKNQLIKSVLEDFEGRVVRQESSMGIPTGFRCYDEALRGLHTKRIIVISGLPSSGKTLIANQIAWAAAESGTPTLKISLEMPAEKLIERNLIFASRLPAKAITDPLEYAEANGNKTPSREHLKQVQSAIKRIQKAPIEYEDPSNCSIGQIIAIIRRHVRQHKTKVVVVDYIQLIKGEKGISREQQLSEISHALQSIAKELDLCLIVLSQQNKEGGTKHAEAITEDADLVMAILKDLNKDSETFGQHKGILVRKDRHYGNNGLILPIYLIKDMLRFEEDQYRN